MTGFAEDDLTLDAFLGGRVRLWQPRSGYRAGVDPVFLAASVAAQPGQAVLDLGCGAGAAALCLAARVPGLRLTGIEVQTAYADLARRNGPENGAEFDVICANLTQPPAALRQTSFDHVIANPPYYRPGAHSPARDTGRSVALGEADTPLLGWFDLAAKRLRPRGFVHMIQRVDRLPEMLAACGGRLGSVEVLPLAARIGRAPDLLLLRAQKGGRAAFRLHAPLILHPGASHRRDGEGYRPEIEAVLRHAAPLCWPDRQRPAER